MNGERVRDSTKQGNKRVAIDIEAAKRTQLAKGEVGIEYRRKAPTLKKFAPRFMETIETQCADKLATISFYRAKLAYLLKPPALAGARLDDIEEDEIEAHKNVRAKSQSRRKRLLSPASINRELATLRRLLRMAHEFKLIAAFRVCGCHVAR